MAEDNALAIKEAVLEAHALLKERLQGLDAGHLIVAIAKDGSASIQSTMPIWTIPDVAKLLVMTAQNKMGPIDGKPPH